MERTIRVTEEDGLSIADTVSIQIKHSLWMTWAGIAIDHEREAWRVRVEPGSSLQPGQRIDDELKSALQAITAAALAIDALYGAVKDLIAVPPVTRTAWECNRTSRHSRILETLKGGLDVGELGSIWAKELDWLFEVRGGAVHYQETFGDVVSHPIVGDAAPIYATYAPEEARRAVDLMLGVLGAAADKPRANQTDLGTWSATIGVFVEQLRDRRS